jgi:hypothetical protein
MKRSTHDLSFTHSTSGDMGLLYPIAAIDVLPGDTMRHAVDMLARVAPMAKPVMHPVDIRVHNFFVPNRLIWEDWEDFIVGNEGSKTYPTITPGSAADTVLFDRFGAEPVTGVAYDALPARAYNLIWNEFFRDQDLSTERTIDLTDGADTTTDLDIARIAWGKDYFTTARANPQQGTAVSLGFSSGLAPIQGLGISDTSSSNVYETDNATAQAYSDRWSVAGTNTGDAALNFQSTEVDSNGKPLIYADLSGASGGIDINELRNSIALQRIAEAREFFGSRYEDYLRFYGINPRDGRLQRPEPLGGSRQRIAFSEVLVTAEGTSTNPGELYGHGIAGLRQRPYRKMFEEHGWIISLLSVRPAGIYQNGIPKRFLRREPTDFWHSELELLPWQEVNELEIYGGGSSANTFGYVPRFDEYRELNSFVSGTFRGGTEEDWTLAREFASAPTLNASFVECTPSDRIYLDTAMPEMLFNIRHNIRARRLVRANARISPNAML